MNSNVKIRAPYPKNKVTTLLPIPQWMDSQTPLADFQLKRTREGRSITHPRLVNDRELKLRFLLTRQKSLELEELFNVYQSGQFWIELHDATKWLVNLVGQPIIRTAVGRQTDSRTDTGEEAIEVTLTFSGLKLT
jgi:hypothetical protein